MNQLTEHYSFEDNKDTMLFSQLLLPLQAILGQMVLYATINGLPWKYTRIIDEKIPNVSVSDTHSEGRAADVSVKGWNIDDIDEFVDYFNKLYGEDYGTSADGKDPRVVVYHYGTGWHFHIQIRREIDLDNFFASFYNSGGMYEHKRNKRSISSSK